MNTAGRLLALLLLALMVLSLAACGAKGGDKMDGMSNEPKNAEEAVSYTHLKFKFTKLICSKRILASLTLAH